MLVNSYLDRQHPVHVDDASQYQDTNRGGPPRFAIGSTHRDQAEERGLLDVGQHDCTKSVRRILCEGYAPLTVLDGILAEPG